MCTRVLRLPLVSESTTHHARSGFGHPQVYAHDDMDVRPGRCLATVHLACIRFHENSIDADAAHRMTGLVNDVTVVIRSSEFTYGRSRIGRDPASRGLPDAR